MSHDVFISYATQDKSTADVICDALEQRMIRCWIAHRDVLPGQNWASAIIVAIAASKLMVLVVSEATGVSANVVREVERAAARELVIVPFRIRDIELTGALEYFVQSCHWLDAVTPPLEEHIAQLTDVIARILTLVDEVRADGLRPTPIRLTVHFAYFANSPRRCCFINATNLYRDMDVELTHVWVDSVPQFFDLNPDRPLPKRLRPRESWETWIPLDRLPQGLHEEDLYRLAGTGFRLEKLLRRFGTTLCQQWEPFQGDRFHSPLEGR